MPQKAPGNQAILRLVRCQAPSVISPYLVSGYCPSRLVSDTTLNLRPHREEA